MRLSELRANSFVNHASKGCIKIFNVDYDKSTIIAQNICLTSTEELDGIVLNSKWLDRLGFIKVSTEAYLNVEVSVFKKDNLFVGLFTNNRARITYNGKSFEIDYVHQLQDFYSKVKGKLL